MLIHVALFRFLPGTGTEAVGAIDQALGALPEAVPDLIDYRFGPDAGIAEGSWDYAVVATFADAEAFARYRSHAAHVAALEDHIRPVLAERASVQLTR